MLHWLLFLLTLLLLPCPSLIWVAVSDDCEHSTPWHHPRYSMAWMHFLDTTLCTDIKLSRDHFFLLLRMSSPFEAFICCTLRYSWRYWAVKWSTRFLHDIRMKPLTIETILVLVSTLSFLWCTYMTSVWLFSTWSDLRSHIACSTCKTCPAHVIFRHDFPLANRYVWNVNHIFDATCFSILLADGLSVCIGYPPPSLILIGSPRTWRAWCPLQHFAVHATMHALRSLPLSVHALSDAPLRCNICCASICLCAARTLMSIDLCWKVVTVKVDLFMSVRHACSLTSLPVIVVRVRDC